MPCIAGNFGAFYVPVGSGQPPIKNRVLRKGASMPSTVNGIGTHYYGKANLEENAGTCEHCGKEATLMTYETRLWFVVLFIPIIPLGKKQVLDECSRCTMHRALPLAEWERLKSEAVSETVEKASQDPDDPDAALDLLGTLHGFRRHDEARDLAAIMRKRFADNSTVQFALAGYYDEIGNTEAAHECCERALAIDPENRDVRAAVAFGCIQKGDLERARELLEFMIEPGPDQDPDLLGMLAYAYQEQERHEDAMTIYASILAGTPALGKDTLFRKAIRASEEALGRQESILPPSTALRTVAIIAAVIVVIVIIVVFAVRAFIDA